MTNLEILTLCSTRHSLRTGEFALTMIKYETIIYEQEDFDVLDKMTNEEAINILSVLPRGYFPYRKYVVRLTKQLKL